MILKFTGRVEKILTGSISDLNQKLMFSKQVRRQRGAMPPPPIFVFAPPDFFLAHPWYFFGRKKLVFLDEKNVKICDFGQKKPSDFGEDLFFFFGDHLLLVGKFMISAKKSLRISAKTFAPLILILPPRSREAGDAPVSKYRVFQKSRPILYS